MGGKFRQTSVDCNRVRLMSAKAPRLIDLSIPNMKCEGCAASIEKAVRAVDASATVRADIEARSINVTTISDRQVLLTALDAAGYPAKAD